MPARPRRPPGPLLVLLLVSSPAVARARLPPSELMVVEPQESVELSWFDRGRMRMYLQQQVLACTISAHRQVEGDVRLSLDLVAGKAPRVTAGAAGRDAGARSVARCLGRALRNVNFPQPAPRWQYTATLRLGGPTIEVELRDLDGPVEKLPAGALFLSNLALSALERPAACMKDYFSSEEAISMVLTARLVAGTAGDAVFREVKESTAVPEALVACVAARLAPVSIPVARPTVGTVRIALLRPTSDVPEGTKVLIQGPTSTAR